MSKIVKRYTKDGVTVVWKPDLCIHSENCRNGLSAVFDPNKRPWINMEGGDVENIKVQVSKCPSGALSIESNEKVPIEETDTKLVEVIRNGPLCVHGSLKVKYADGSEENKSTKTFFCRCGQSSKKPYCDGTHKKVDFVG